MIQPVIGIKENCIYWREFSILVIRRNIKDMSQKFNIRKDLCLRSFPAKTSQQPIFMGMPPSDTIGSK